MKHVLILILLFSLVEIQAQEINFIGKWVFMGIDKFENGSFVEHDKNENNIQCPELLIFLPNDVVQVQSFSNSCEAEDDYTGTYSYKDNYLTLTFIDKEEVHEEKSSLKLFSQREFELSNISTDSEGKKTEIIGYFQAYHHYIKMHTK